MSCKSDTPNPDSLGRTIKTVAKDSQGDVIVETKYDFLGRVSEVSNPYRQGETVLWSRTSYDELGRAVETFAPAPSGQTGDSLGTTSYEFSTVANYLGTAITTTDAAGKSSRSITNALGQLIAAEEPDHDGNLPALPQSTPVPDPTPNPNPTPPGGGDPNCRLRAYCPEIPEQNLTEGEYSSYPTLYTYDPTGKMVMVEQGEQKRFFKYDSLGRMIRVSQPEQERNTSLDMADPYNTSGHWTAGFTYDVLGNVLTATDANGVTITNTYDNAGRVKTRTYSDTTPAVSFFYDGKGLDSTQSPNFAKGKLTKVTSSVSETRYKLFDYLGRMTEMSQITDGQTYTSKYTYNFAGALVEEEYPSGRKVKNEFEPDGDLSRIYGTANSNASERTYANTFSYLPDGRIEKLRLGNGLWERAKFNSRLQVTELSIGRGISSGELWKLGYEYGEIDGNGDVDATKNTGNVARQTLSFNGLAHPFVQTYKYDSLYRLTEARETSNGGQTWKQNFGYDRYGNRTGHDKFSGTTAITQTTLTHPAIDAATNRFTANQGYVYDKNGNLVEDAENRAFVFNGDNKQKEIRDGNNVIVGEYFYDGEGKRVKKKAYDSGVLNDETIFIYSSGKLIAEYSNKPPSSTPTTSWTITDQLGSPRVLVNTFGEVVSRRDFLPFGEEIFPDANNLRTNAALKYNADGVRQKFTGYQKDEESGLDFAEARMYENRHGRFTAVDPLLASGKSFNPQTFNRFVYVLNNPLVFTDPEGLQAGVATGKVFRRGRSFAIFRGEPAKGYSPVTRTIHTQTSINGVQHYATVNPGGWEIGDRVDGARFAAPPVAPTFRGNSDISQFLGGFKRGYEDSINGAKKGALNFGIGTINGITDVATGGTWRNVAGYSNPFEIERYSYKSLTEAKFGLGTEGGLIGGSVIVPGVFSGNAVRLSVVPETEAAVATTFPPIKAGSLGETGGSRYISTDVRRQAAAENPDNICVFCHMKTDKPQLDHATAWSRGGDNSIQNIQVACQFCNGSKGNREFPLNPPPGYEGPFPPPWWSR